MVANSPYERLEELAAHLIDLAAHRSLWRSSSVPNGSSQGAHEAGPRAPSLRRRADADDKAALGGARSGQRIAAAQFRLVRMERDAAHRRPMAQVRGTGVIDDIDYLRSLILARCPEISAADLIELADSDADFVLDEIAAVVDGVVEAFEERLDKIETKLAAVM